MNKLKIIISAITAFIISAGGALGVVLVGGQPTKWQILAAIILGLVVAAKDTRSLLALPPVEDGKDAAPKPPIFGLFILSIALSALVFSGIACTTIQPGNDPLVVRVEQVQTTAKGAFDLILHVDHANRDFYRTNAPNFHGFCEWLRVPTVTADGGTLPRASAILWTLDAEKLAYKNGTSSSNNVVAALMIVNETATQAQAWITALNLKR